jgi:parvulin-like peptidyl-prolyl isomerase
LAVWHLVVCSVALAQSNSNQPVLSAQQRIAATVGTLKISTNAAAGLLAKSLPNSVNAQPNPALLNVAVNQLIDRAVVFEYLKSIDAVAGNNEIRLELEVFKSELATIEQTLEDHLDAVGQTQQELEFEISWRISWNRFLRQQLTNERLQTYFADHRRQFDDSEMRVAHLLLKPDENRSIAETINHANGILEDLNSNHISWSQAVAQHSAAPTRNQGGEIGWIKYSQPMPNEFSMAAFELQPTEISQPIATHFGVHLIKCLEIKEGKTGWRDALEELQRSASIDLLQQITTDYRPKLTIEYGTGFQPTN